MFKKTFILIFVLLGLYHVSEGQLTESADETTKLQFSIGLINKSTIVHPLTTEGISHIYGVGKTRYARPGAFSGLGISPGLELTYKGFGFEYHSFINYGEIYVNVRPDEKDEHFLMIDHNLNAYYLHKKTFYKIGFTIFNDNRSIPYTNGYVGSQSIEYVSYNLGLARNFFTRYQVELKINYSPTGYPNDPKLASMIYSLRISYRFDPINPWFWKKE